MSASSPTSSPQAVGLMDALDMPEQLKVVQDCYWQARRDWTELQHAYLTVIEHMVSIHDPEFVDEGKDGGPDGPHS